MTKNGPLILVLIAMVIVAALYVVDRQVPEPNETPVVTDRRTPGGLVHADVVLMKRYKGKLVLNVEKDLDVYVAKGEFLPNETPNFAANLMRLMDDHAYIGCTGSQIEDGAMLQILCQKKKLPEGALERVPADREPDTPKQGDICAAFVDPGLISGRAVYVCLKESDTLKSNYQVVGHIDEGLDELAKLDGGVRIQNLHVERVLPGLEGRL